MKRAGRIVALFLALVLAMLSLTACSSNPPETVGITVNGKKIYMDEMMYYVYLEEEAYSYYDQMYQAYYGTSFWDTAYDDTTSMADQVKEEIVKMATWYNLLADKAVESGMTLSEEETTQVSEDVTTLFEELSETQKKTLSLTEARANEIMTRIKLAQNFYVQTIDGYQVDRDQIAATVNQEDYQQFDVEYIKATVMEAQEDNSYADIEGAEETRTVIDGLVEKAENGDELATMASANDKLSSSTLTFTKLEAADNAMYTEIMGMKVGDVITYQDTTDYYLLRLKDNTSKDSFENAVTTAYQSAQDDQFELEYAQMCADTKIKVKHVMKKMELGSVTAKSAEEIAAEEAANNENSDSTTIGGDTTTEETPATDSEE